MREVHNTPSVSPTPHTRPAEPTRKELSGAMLAESAGSDAVQASQRFFIKGEQEKFKLDHRQYTVATHGGGQKSQETKATTAASKVATTTFKKVLQHQFTPRAMGKTAQHVRRAGS